MEIIRAAWPKREMADVKVWPCRGCSVVHMSVKDVVYNFTREEFAAFTEAVVDIHYTGWPRENALAPTDRTDYVH